MSREGSEVLNRSPANKMKSTCWAMQLSMAWRNAEVERSRILGSRQEPRWRSARWAYFIVGF